MIYLTALKAKHLINADHSPSLWILHVEYCVLRCGAGVSRVDLKKKSFDDFLMFISIRYNHIKIRLLKIRLTLILYPIAWCSRSLNYRFSWIIDSAELSTWLNYPLSWIINLAELFTRLKYPLGWIIQTAELSSRLNYPESNEVSFLLSY